MRISRSWISAGSWRSCAECKHYDFLKCFGGRTAGRCAAVGAAEFLLSGGTDGRYSPGEDEFRSKRRWQQSVTANMSATYSSSLPHFSAAPFSCFHSEFQHFSSLSNVGLSLNSRFGHIALVFFFRGKISHVFIFVHVFLFLFLGDFSDKTSKSFYLFFILREFFFKCSHNLTVTLHARVGKNQPH